MRVLVFFLIIVSSSWSFAQYDYYEPYSPYYDYTYDTNDYKMKYPYITNYTPSFLGLIVGYNVLKAQEIEAGLVFNLAETQTDFGMTGGYQLIYKRSLERNFNSIDAELGVYGLVSMGIGVNYNFSETVSAWGFKPFIGTSIYHFQLLYGYNFLRKKKQSWYQLPQHSLSIRYVLPIKAGKRTYFYLPPAPTYDHLKGLNNKHPVQGPIHRGYRY